MPLHYTLIFSLVPIVKSPRPAFACVACILAITACGRDPNYAKHQFLTSGNKYFDRGRYKEAMIMYRKALAKDPKFGEGYYRLAKTFEVTGQAENLVGSLRRATELMPPGTPEWNDAALKLGELLVQGAIAQNGRGQNKPLMDEVNQLKTTLEQRAPNSFENVRLKAEIKRAEAAQDLSNGNREALKKDLQESIQYLRRSLQLKPNDTNTTLTLARSLALSGDLAEAENVYKGVISRDPKQAMAYLELYRVYAGQKRNAEAEDTLKHAIVAVPKDYQFRTLLAGFYFSQNDRPKMTQTLEEIKQHFREIPQAFLTSGDFYTRIGDYDAAIAQYREGEQKDPTKKSEYGKRIVDVLLRQGKSADAYAKTAQMLKEDPKNNDARAMEATFKLERGETAQAAAELQDVVTAKPEDYTARFELGRAHAAKGEYQQAIQQYRESIRLRPDYLKPRVALAEAELQTGDPQAALSTAQDIEKLAPQNPQGKLLQATALIRLNKSTEARPLLQELVQKFPKFAEANLEWGELEARDKNYAAAREWFHKGYLANPKDLQGLHGEAMTWLAQNQPEKALSLVAGEAVAHPENNELRREHASLKAVTGQTDAALADDRTLLDIYKSNVKVTAQLHAAMGELYVHKGDLNAALDSLQKARALDPNNAALLNFTAQTEERAGRFQEAQALYRSVLALDPGNPAALNNLAFALANNGGDLNEALTLANRAKQRVPNVNEVNDTIGFIYIKKKMDESAIDLFRSLTTKAPENPTYHYHYCMALVQKGEKAAAQKECAAALAAKPAKSEEAGVRQLMAKLQ